MLTKRDQLHYLHKRIRASAVARSLFRDSRLATPDSRCPDPLDRAVANHDQHVSNEFRGLRLETLVEIDAAKGRLRNGKFGLCEECTREIPRTRLDAIPWARHCVGCAQVVRQTA